MGKEIDLISKESEEFEIVSISFKNQDDVLDLKGIASADVAIEFTSKDVVIKNIEEVAKLGVNLIVGTTGWYDELDTVKKIVNKYKIGFMYAPNFSIGANVFFKMVAFSSKLFSKFPDYDVYGSEIHHKGKLDSPSGTAFKIASEILENFPAKKSIQTNEINGPVDSKELHFTSIRAGRNPGFHEVVFDSNADGVALSHQAYNRSGFAQGSLVAAKFIKGKKGFFSFEDLFK